MTDDERELTAQAIEAVHARVQADIAVYARRRERRLWLGLAATAVLGVLAILTVGVFAFLAVVLVAYLVGDESGFNAGWDRACRLPVDTAIALDEYHDVNRSWRDQD